jgi:hypothetical protein
VHAHGRRPAGDLLQSALHNQGARAHGGGEPMTDELLRFLPVLSLFRRQNRVGTWA